MAHIVTAARFEVATRTIRSVPGNHWLASMDSWDGAIDHDGMGLLFARAPRVERAARALLDAFGGNVPDWLATECDNLEEALAVDLKR